MTQMTNIQGIIRLASPMHVAQTDKPGETVVQRIIANGIRTEVPYFPANDLRGRLRRKAAAILMDALKTSDQAISVELYAGLCAGAIDAAPESNLTVEEAHRASKNLYMGLFGGGARMLRSRFSVQDAMPVIRSTIDAGLVPANFGRSVGAEENLPSYSYRDSATGQTVTKDIGSAFEITGERGMIRIDDVTRVARPDEMVKYIDDCTAAVMIHQTRVFANRKDVKADKAANVSDDERTKKSDTANMMSVNAMIPGSKLFCRLDMQDTVTEAQTGLMIVALRDLLNEQGLGGWVRTGFGKFNTEDFELNIGGRKVALFGEDEFGRLTIAEPAHIYVDAMRAELATLQSADMMAFFQKLAETDEKKEKKTAKAKSE